MPHNQSYPQTRLNLNLTSTSLPNDPNRTPTPCPQARTSNPGSTAHFHRHPDLPQSRTLCSAALCCALLRCLPHTRVLRSARQLLEDDVQLDGRFLIWQVLEDDVELDEHFFVRLPAVLNRMPHLTRPWHVVRSWL